MFLRLVYALLAALLRSGGQIMQLDNHFDPTSEAFPLPDRLLERVDKLSKDLVRVAVEKRIRKSWKKVNGFALSESIDGEPSDTAEHIATLIVAIAAYDVEDSGEPATYRARFVRIISGKEDKKTFSFKQGLGDDSEAILDASDSDMSSIIGMVLQQQAHFITIQNAHLEAQNNRILEFSHSSTQQIHQLLKTNELLVDKYHKGLAMQSNAMALTLDVERNLAADKMKGQNQAALIDMLKMAAPAAVTQFGAYMQSRAKPGEETQVEKQEINAENEEHTPTDIDLSSDIDLRTNPLTVFAHAFRDSLSSDQALEIGQLLSALELEALQFATSRGDDVATAEAVLSFRDLLMAGPNLVRISALLSADQTTMLLKLNELAADS